MLFIGRGLRGFKAFLFSFLVPAVYAGTDEFHQLFVKGRSGLLSDVGIDCLGGLFGLGIYAIIITAYKKYKTHNIIAKY